MTTGVRCPNCDAPLSEGGRYCIECGRETRQPATGATERLPDVEGGVYCANCGVRNPPGAQFCVMCGRGLAGSAPVATADPAPQIASIAPAPPPTPIAPWGAAAPMPVAPLRAPGRAMWGGVSGGVFLIGLAVLAITGWWWPGILVLIGITALGGSAASGQRWAGVQGALWLFGLAFIAQFNLWWPGILVLAGLSAILSAIWRSRR